MYKTFTIIFVAVLSWGFAQAQTTITLQPDPLTGKDAMLHGLSSEANSNGGDNALFIANAWTFDGISGVVRSVIEFNLTSIPANAVIGSAKLSLYASDNATAQHSQLSGSNACWLERVTAGWNASIVTWNTQPKTTAVNRVSLSASTSATQNYIDINVTALVKDMRAESNFGFMLKLQDENFYRRMSFCSSNHTNPALRPKLSITYSFPTEISEPTTENNIVLVYPNPAAGQLTIQFANNDLIRDTKFILTNSLGQGVKQISLNTTTSKIGLDGVVSGLYFYELRNGQKSIKTGKIFIE